MKPSIGIARMVLALAAIGTPVLATAASPSPVSFTAPLTYTTDNEGLGVATGDFNGDGKTDVVVGQAAFHGTYLVFALLGNGDGAFQMARGTAVEGQPQSIAVGDFNHDGKLDVVVGLYDSIAILLGKGDGTFQKAVNYKRGHFFPFVAVGDFNGDGNLDVVTSGAVLLGNGDGTLQAPLKDDSLAGGPEVVIADLNGDGKLDFVGDRVLLGRGDGTFQKPAKYPDPSPFVAVGDFNEDGIPDLVSVYTAFYIMLGNGNGTFQAASTVPAACNQSTGEGLYGSGSLSVGDFNGDGHLDLACVSNENIQIALGNGNGTFQSPQTYLIGGQPASVAWGDFNGDGLPDLTVTNFNPTGRVSMFLNVGQGALQQAPSVSVGPGPTSVAVADFNGDGKQDLVVANYNNGHVSGSSLSILLGKGNGTFQTQTSVGASSNPDFVATGDFNGDGKPDLAVAAAPSSSSSGEISILLGNGDGTFQSPVAYLTDESATSIAIADYNGDGKPDLAVCGGNQVWILLGNGDGTFGSPTAYTVGQTCAAIVAADFNGDGHPDLAVADSSDSADVVWTLQGDGDGTFEPAVSHKAHGVPLSLAFGKFGPSGSPDLVVGTFAPYRVSVAFLRNDGAGDFQVNGRYLLDSGAVTSLGVADFNGDGNLDVAAVGQGGAVTMLLGDGNGHFTAQTAHFVPGDNPSAGTVGDFNGDGKPDLAVTNSGSNTVSILTNVTP